MSYDYMTCFLYGERSKIYASQFFRHPLKSLFDKKTITITTKAAVCNSDRGGGVNLSGSRTTRRKKYGISRQVFSAMSDKIFGFCTAM